MYATITAKIDNRRLLSRAEFGALVRMVASIAQALRQSPECAALARALKKYRVMLAAVRCTWYVRTTD